MKYEQNVGMKVFSKLYVGFRQQMASYDYDSKTGQLSNVVYAVPLGFATPHEDNAQGRKRQTTVDSWAKHGFPHGVPALQAKLINNELAEGFKVTDDIKRTYYGGGNVVFRIEDPRGFELEIQAQNLMTIIRLVGINEGGVIPGKCCWGRDGANNILIHESSEEYKTARLAAETIKPLAGLEKSKFGPGDKVVLTNGLETTYLGRYWFTSKSQVYEDYVGFDPVVFTSNVGDIKRHEGSEAQYVINAPIQYHAVDSEHEVLLYRDIKVANIVEKGSMSTEEALKYINGREMRAAANSTYNIDFISASTDKKAVMHWVKTPLSQELFHTLIKKVHEDKHRSNRESMWIYKGYDDADECPFFFAVQTETGLWQPSSYQSYDCKGLFYPYGAERSNYEYPFELVRYTDTKLSITGPKSPRHNDYYHRTFHVSNSGIEVPLMTLPPLSKEEVLNQLKTWYNEGKLYTFKAEYKD
jgi:hypothetical protein